MALKWIDGFDSYTVSTTSMNRRWSLSNPSGIFTSSTGRTGTGKCLIQSASTTSTFWQTFDNHASWVVGFATFINQLQNVVIVSLRDSGTIQCDIRMNSTGQLTFTRNGTVLASTPVDTLQAGTWLHIEFKATIANSIAADSCVVRINGSAVLTVPAGSDTQSTTNAVANQVAFLGGTSHRFDDIYICDGSGTSNNDFLGDCRVATILPTGAGSSTNLTPNSGANYAAVDDDTPDDDTTYVQGATGVDTYTFDNIPTASISVKGLQVNTLAKKDVDGDVRTIAPTLRVSSTDYVGATKTLGTSYLNIGSVWEENPSTSAAWTPEEVNSAEFGVTVG